MGGMVFMEIIELKSCKSPKSVHHQDFCLYLLYIAEIFLSCLYIAEIYCFYLYIAEIYCLYLNIDEICCLDFYVAEITWLHLYISEISWLCLNFAEIYWSHLYYIAETFLSDLCIACSCCLYITKIFLFVPVYRPEWPVDQKWAKHSAPTLLPRWPLHRCNRQHQHPKDETMTILWIDPGTTHIYRFTGS